MARSVVLRPTARCPACRMPHRWCICAGFATVETSLRVDVLMDRLEQYRPTSTGMLIQRAMPASRQHLFERQARLDRTAICDPEREVWILHTRGEPMPADADPARVQALLLDGSWQAVQVMLPHIEGWGRRVRLPVAAPSRYWLRDAQAADRLSTAEALFVLLESLGQLEAAAALRLQFELLVYAGLLVRGKRAEALDFLVDSPVRTALPELAARLRASNRAPIDT
jgi:DTW domain-containing protein